MKEKILFAVIGSAITIIALDIVRHYEISTPWTDIKHLNQTEKKADQPYKVKTEKTKERKQPRWRTKEEVKLWIKLTDEHKRIEKELKALIRKGSD